MLRPASRLMSWASVSFFFIDELLFELEQITPSVALASRHLRHRQLQPLLLRTSLRNLIPRIRMPHHAGAGAVPQHPRAALVGRFGAVARSEEHQSELQSLMRTSYAVFSLKKKKIYIDERPM